jgi:hypothetical protein
MPQSVRQKTRPKVAAVVLVEPDEPESHKIDVVLYPKVHFDDPPSPYRHIR